MRRLLFVLDHYQTRGGLPYKKDGGVRRMSILRVKGLGVQPQNVLQQELSRYKCIEPKKVSVS